MGYAFVFFVLIELLDALASRAMYNIWPDVAELQIEGQRSFYQLFWAFMSAAIGQTIQFSSWLGIRQMDRRLRLKSRKAIAISFAAAFITLIFFNTYAFGMYLLTMGSGSVGTELNFYQRYGWIFYLVPLWLFFLPWNFVRTVYVTRYWQIVVFAFYCMLALALCEWSASHLWSIYPY